MGKILEALALLRADGRLPIEGLVEAEVRNLPRGSTVVMITPATDKSVLVSVELLSRRGMRPVVVLLDAVSFGGPEGSEALVKDLEMLNIPVCRVANGDDLSVTLSEASRHQIWA